MRLKHFSLLFSFVGILLLYLLSTFSQTSFIEINEIPDYEGKQVTIKGTVKEYRTTNYGSQIITIENNNITTTVFIEGNIEVEYGDIIQATGEVQKYKDSWEVVVNDERFVKIIEKWNNISSPIWQLAENPSRYVGLNVNVSGYIDAVYDSYFYLVDLDGKHSLIVFYNPSTNITLYTNNEEVCVTGRFLFDEKNLCYNIEISEEKHGIFLIGG